MIKKQNLEITNEALRIGDVTNSSLVLKTNEIGDEIIRIQKDGKIFIRGEETTDDKTIGQALKVFALYYPNFL
jgi:sporulation protein YlmC with PRC-barrel domain